MTSFDSEEEGVRDDVEEEFVGFFFCRDFWDIFEFGVRWREEGFDCCFACKKQYIGKMRLDGTKSQGEVTAPLK